MARAKIIMPRQCGIIIVRGTRRHVPNTSTPENVEVGTRAAGADTVGVIEAIELARMIEYAYASERSG